MNVMGKKDKIIRIWLEILAFMIVVMVSLGGITRLSKAGLAIVEWRPVTGIIPPLTQRHWEEEFEKYKKIPQYRRLMFSISLQEFKKLYILEYLHRLWGRIIGFAVIFPLIILSLKKIIDRTWVKYFITFIFLIFVQGVLGWLMVRTGIVEDRIFVSPIFLALHNTFALGLYSFVLYGIYKAKTMEKQVVSQNEVINQNIGSKNYEEAEFSPELRKIKMLSLVAILLFVFQFIAGTLVAGHKAALLAPTYPDMNGHLIPQGLFSQKDFLNNPLFLNFFHRHFALILGVVLILLALKRVFLPIILWLIQFILGIITTLNSKGDIPVVWGVLHQVNAWLLFTSLFFTFFNLRAQKSLFPSSTFKIK
jgi:cytochrome c oxidase assembly protein subunit 15